MKIKFLDNLYQNSKKNIKDYKWTFLSIILICIYYMFKVIANKTLLLDSSKISERLWMFAFGCLAIESLLYTKDNKILKLVLLVVNLAISWLFEIIPLETDRKSIYLFGLVSIELLLGIYFIIKNSKLEFSEYATRFLGNFIRLTVVYLLVQLLGMSILGLLSLLLISRSSISWKLIEIFQIMVNGLFYIPMIITVSTSLKEMDVEFIRKLVKYLFIPVEIAAMVIVYIYMSKIIVTAKYPSNEIFEIIGTIFAYSFIIWILQGSFKEEKKFFKYTQKYLPIAFIPLWIFQLVSLGMRIVAYSVTTRRYIGIFILIFEIIAILILIIKKQKANNLFIVGMVMMAILTLVPGLNMIDFPNLIQEHIYKSPESKSELYDYKDDSLVIEDDRDLPKYFDYYDNTQIGKNDISKYKEIQLIPDEDEKNIDEEDTPQYIKDIISKLINGNTKKDIKGEIDRNPIVYLDKKRDILISSLNITYDKNGVIKRYTVRGYYLYKGEK